jgi:hypothetical protein
MTHLRIAPEFPSLLLPRFSHSPEIIAVKIPVAANTSTRFTGSVVIGVPAGVLVADPNFKH